jgi:hypothetical protein
MASGGSRICSDPSNTDAICTLVHDPTGSDFALTDIGGGQVQIDITVPANAYELLTGVKVERADDAGFTTGVTTIQDFTANYSLVDTPGQGIWYYRITFCNQENIETAVSTSKEVTVP